MNTLRIYISVFFLCSGLYASAQRCNYEDLSEEFEFATNMRRYKTGTAGDSCQVRIFVTQKKNNHFLQKISYYSLDFYNDAFLNCENKRSYTTGKNKNNETENGNYGDLVVADFNFDGEEDFAVINHSGGISGPSYSFYIQAKDKHFELDSNMTSLVNFFPAEIHKTTKRLITIVPVSASEKTRTVFQYHRRSKTWTKVHQEFITDK